LPPVDLRAVCFVRAILKEKYEYVTSVMKFWNYFSAITVTRGDVGEIDWPS
jgi:hypothetical protein